MNEKIRIAVDAMGGDYAPAAVVEGAILAQNENYHELELVLVGERGKINQELSRLKATDLPFTVRNASEQIRMGDQAAESLRKKDSSIAVGMRLQKEGKVDAFVSGGNTGAIMTHALVTLGRLEEVNRPAIASFLPSEKGIVLVLDVGANAECKAQ
ncbi:MAG: phosphate--acyl-ACP acyltransferase, partial [Candidatus Zixiibacteriota bacterium]